MENNEQQNISTISILNEKGKEKRKYAPRPTSRANVAKARDVRMTALKKAKEEYELKRLMHLQEQKMNEIKKGMGVLSKENEQQQQQKKPKTVILDTSSDSSSSSDEDEIIYVPTKKVSKSKKEVKDDSELLRKELEEIKKMVKKPQDEPKVEPKVEVKTEPTLSAYDQLQRSQLDYLKSSIMKF